MRLLVACTAALLLPWVTAAATAADVSAGIHLDDDGVRGFHVALREHYHADEAAFAACRARAVPDEHLPVVFFIAHRAKVSPVRVLDLRASGKSWMDVSLQLGLGVEVFHVDVRKAHGPPYGKALGHFKDHPRHAWAAIRLPDDDIVTLVNVSFLAARFGSSPDEVIELRGRHASFLHLHAHLKKEKAAGGKGPGEGRGAAERGAAGKHGAGGGAGAAGRDGKEPQGGGDTRGGARGGKGPGGGKGWKK